MRSTLQRGVVPEDPGESVALARAALVPHALGPVRLRLLHRGQNTTWDVRTPQGRFALQVARPGLLSEAVRVRDAWAREVEAGAGVPMVRIRETPEGAPGVWVAGHAAVLHHWLPGVVRTRSFGVRQARLAGRCLARIHGFGNTFRPPADWHLPRLDRAWLHFPSPLPQLDPRARAVCAEAAERVDALLVRLHAESCVILHGDFHPRNLRFQRGGEVAVLDLENLGWGHPLQDLGNALCVLRWRPDAAPIERAFLEGYADLRELPGTAGELEALVVCRTLGVIANVVADTRPRVARIREVAVPGWVDQVAAWLG